MSNILTKREKEIFKGVHEVILQGFDAVKDLIRESLKNKDSSLEGDDLEKKVKRLEMENELLRNFLRELERK